MGARRVRPCTRVSTSPTSACGSAFWCWRRTLFFDSAAGIASPAWLSTSDRPRAGCGGGGLRSRSPSGRNRCAAGNATALSASSRCAAPPLRSGPSGDTATAVARWLMTTGRVLPVVTDRLLTRPAADVAAMPLTSSRRGGRFRSSRVPNQSEYTLIRPSDCPTNQDHLRVQPIQSRDFMWIQHRMERMKG